MNKVAFVPFSGHKELTKFWEKHAQAWKDKFDYVWADERPILVHGEKMREFVLQRKDADLIMFIEEDGIILKPEMIDTCFNYIESGEYDIVGSPRMSCTPEFAEACAKKFNLSYEGLGDKGPALWPNFLFCKREDLLKTDLDFILKAWQPGEYIKELDYTVQNPISGDTAVWVSIQLRALGLRIREVPQYHSSPFDLEHLDKGEGVFDGQAPWFHVGSLAGDFSPIQTEMERLEAEKRVMWWQICGRDMEDVIVKYELRRGNINRWKEAYLRLMSAH